MRTREAKFAKCRPVGSQFIGDDNCGSKALATKEFAEKAHCHGFVVLGLNENFQNLALAVDGTPHVHLISRERDHHFIKMGLQPKAMEELVGRLPYELHPRGIR